MTDDAKNNLNKDFLMRLFAGSVEGGVLGSVASDYLRDVMNQPSLMSQIMPATGECDDLPAETVFKNDRRAEPGLWQYEDGRDFVDIAVSKRRRRRRRRPPAPTP